MNKLNHPPKFLEILGFAFCLILAGVSCAPQATATPSATPLIQTVEVTRVVTQVVTRVVEVPVTVTPGATLQPAVSQEALPGLAGKWIDPDSSGGGTVSTIVWQHGTYAVTSVVNSNRGGNEIKTSSWSNGVLTWEYCPPLQQHCLVQNTVSLNGDILTVNWDWFGGGHPGTSDLQRQP